MERESASRNAEEVQKLTRRWIVLEKSEQFNLEPGFKMLSATADVAVQEELLPWDRNAVVDVICRMISVEDELVGLEREPLGQARKGTR